MKKGFTLVEIIISISLILIIGVSTAFFFLKKSDNKNDKFENILKNSSLVLLENIKNDKNSTQIKQPNDFICLSINDYIEEGLIEENVKDSNNELLKNVKDQRWVKIYMTDDYQISVMYLKLDEYESECVSELFVEFIDNPYEDGCVLASSSVIVEHWKEDNKSDELFANIQSGNYKKCWDGTQEKEIELPDAKLVNGLGQEYKINGDWTITEEPVYKSEYDGKSDKERGKWVYTYTADYNGKEYSKDLEIKFIDNSAPVMISVDKTTILEPGDTLLNNENTYLNYYIPMTYSYVSGIDYNPYQDFLNFNWNGSTSLYDSTALYHTFDNYEGLKENQTKDLAKYFDFWEFSSLGENIGGQYDYLLKPSIDLKDNIGNINNYIFNFKSSMEPLPWLDSLKFGITTFEFNSNSTISDLWYSVDCREIFFAPTYFYNDQTLDYVDAYNWGSQVCYYVNDKDCIPIYPSQINEKLSTVFSCGTYRFEVTCNNYTGSGEYFSGFYAKYGNCDNIIGIDNASEWTCNQQGYFNDHVSCGYDYDGDSIVDEQEYGYDLDNPDDTILPDYGLTY